MSKVDIVRERWVIMGVMAAACLVFLVQAAAWPLSKGSDARDYLLYYADFTASIPLYQNLMLMRTPLAPLFCGGLLEAGGPRLLEAVLGVLFCGSVVLVYLLGRMWGRSMGLASVVVVLAYPSCGALYHQVSSDALFAVCFLAWSLFVMRTALRTSLGGMVWIGVGVGLLALIRPVGQLLVFFCIFPLLCREVDLKRRWVLAAGFGAAALCILLGWSLHNYIRYDDFTISRTAAANLPLYRVFSEDRIVGPENGPASRELALEVKKRLLTVEPYLAYKIDEATFFSCGDSRMWADLVGLSDRVWGWDSDYRNLRGVAWEALRAHPGGYAASLFGSLWHLYTQPYVWQAAGPSTAAQWCRAASGPPAIESDRRIPISHQWWLASSPDGGVQVDWAGYLSTGGTRFLDPGHERRRAELEKRLAAMCGVIPTRAGSWTLGRMLTALTVALPPMALWGAVGLVGLLLMKNKGSRALFWLLGMSFLIVFTSTAGMRTTMRFRVPFDPLLIVGGLVGGRFLLASACATRACARFGAAAGRMSACISEEDEGGESVQAGSSRVGEVEPKPKEGL